MTEKVGEFARLYWPIIIGVLAVAVAWGASTAQIASIGDGQKTIATKLDLMVEKIAAQQATTNYAVQEIADMRSRLRDIEAKR